MSLEHPGAWPLTAGEKMPACNGCEACCAGCRRAPDCLAGEARIGLLRCCASERPLLFAAAPGMGDIRRLSFYALLWRQGKLVADGGPAVAQQTSYLGEAS